MTDFYEGKVAATFQVGSQIEDTKDAYDKEIIGLEGAKAAMISVVKVMEDYFRHIQQERTQGKLPLKEGDVALKHVGVCIEQMKKMFLDIDAKRNSALGAAKALERVIADVKAAWDKETIRLKEIKEFESKKPHEMKERPIGYMPEEPPIEEYKEETEKQLKEVSHVTEPNDNLKENKSSRQKKRPAEGRPPQQ